MPIVFNDNFNRANGSPGSPWTMTDYGGHVSHGIVSNQLQIVGTFDFYNTYDRACWLNKPRTSTGDFSISVTCVSIVNPGYCRMLMMRESNAANSAMITAVQNSSADDVTLLWRDSTDASAGWTGGGGPAFLGKVQTLTYAAGVVSLYVDGVFVTSRSISWVPKFVGMAVENNATNATVTYDNFIETQVGPTGSGMLLF